jgi:hypothetical protein
VDSGKGRERGGDDPPPPRIGGRVEERKMKGAMKAISSVYVEGLFLF